MSSVLIAENANPLIKEYLKRKNYNVIDVKKTDAVYESVSAHPDIYICKIGKKVIVAKEQLPFLQKELDKNKIPYQEGASFLGSQYPNNIKYNAVHMGDYLIHHTKYTDEALLEEACDNGLNLIHVKQGYTKCSMVVVDNHSVITSDEGLLNALTSKNIDVLKIQRGFVKLKGFPYGFLGGASGKIGSTIVFNGNLEEHPDHIKIKQFIKKKGLRVTYFTEYPLEDIGSIIEVGDDI